MGELQVTYNMNNKINLRVDSPEAAFRIFISMLDQETLKIQEQFSAIFLDRGKKVVGFKILNTGTANGSLIDVPLLLSLALLCRAHSVILCHNHPSGYLWPSDADIAVTEKLKLALSVIEITLDDHMIISHNGCYSMFYEQSISLSDENKIYSCDDCRLSDSIINTLIDRISLKDREIKALTKRVGALRIQLRKANKKLT